MGFGQTYVPIVRELFGKVGRAYEFCAGPGFIGFSLLAAGLCDSLCLSDINPEAVELAIETVRRNKLQDRVSVYLSDALDAVPPHERWDLVVSNPPHFVDQYANSLRHHDPDWQCHRKFYSRVAGYLNPGASLLIQENYAGSREEDFAPMLGVGGLQSLASLMYRAPVTSPSFDTYYFLWSRSRGEVLQPARPAGRTFVYTQSQPAVVIPVTLSWDRAPQIELKACTLYRFALVNNLDRDTTLLVHAVTYRVRRRLLGSVCTVVKGQSSTTFQFQMSPGRYELRDAASKRRLLVIVVA
jgi:hypothetical protein